MGKILTLKEFTEIGKEIQSKKKVLVGGCFEILHFGHTEFLTKAKDTGELLIIALESDQFIKERKKRQPVHNEKQRAMMLSSLCVVDYIIQLPFLKTDEQYTELVRTISPAIIAVTKGDPYTDIKIKQAEQIGAKVQEVITRLPGLSTSSIISYATISSN